MPSEVDKKKRYDLLKTIRDEVVDLKNSELRDERVANKMLPVIGEGSHFAKIMFIGEAPGKNEAETGRPFCGRSGAILDELLESIKIPREEVYVTNIVKDRPPANRDPRPDEIEVYAPFLDRQIEIIQPVVIATLGRFSMEYIMKRYNLSESLDSISKIHGNVFETKLPHGKIKVVPLYHPAVAVYNSHSKDTLKEDFQKLIELL